MCSPRRTRAAAPEGRLLRLARGYRLAELRRAGRRAAAACCGDSCGSLYIRSSNTRHLLRSASLMRAPMAGDDPASACGSCISGERWRCGRHAQPTRQGQRSTRFAPKRCRALLLRLSSPRRRNISSRPSGLNYQQVVQRYAPGTLLQTGPGIPRMAIQGIIPIHGRGRSSRRKACASSTSARAPGLWRIAGVALLAALFAALLTQRRNEMALAALGLDIQAHPSSAAAARSSSRWHSLAVPHARAEATPDAICSLSSRPPDPSLRNACRAARTSAAARGHCPAATSLEVELDRERTGHGRRRDARRGRPMAARICDGRWRVRRSRSRAKRRVAVDSAHPGAHKVRLAGRLAAAESIQVIVSRRATPHLGQQRRLGCRRASTRAAPLRLARTDSPPRRHRAAASFDTRE